MDYKILSKVITYRLKKIMTEIIGEDQSCGVTGRNIQDNLMILRDIIYYIYNKNKQGAMLSINRIEWDYMFRALNKTGYSR